MFEARTAILPADADPQTALERAAGLSFLLFVAALPWSIAPMSIGAVLCGALTILVWLRRRRLEAWRTPLFYPWLGWLAALVVATVFAVDPAGSAPRIPKGFLFALVPLAAYHARGEAARRRMAAVLLASAAVATIYALGKFIAGGAAFPERVKGLVNHPMTYGGQAMLLITFVWSLFLRAPGARWRLAGLGLLALLTPALLGSFTRSAWIGTIAAVSVLLARVRARWIVGLAALVAVSFLVLPRGYRDRALSALDPAGTYNVERLYLWDAGLRMFLDRPATGVGLQDLRDLYDRYRSPRATEHHGHLHNVVIHVAASMGLVGLAALGWLLAGLYRTAGCGWWAPLPRDDLASVFRLTAVAGLTGFLIAGLFEWNLGDEELIDFLCLLVGAGYAACRDAASSRGSPAAEGDPVAGSVSTEGAG